MAYSRILVPLDGSAVAEKALPYARLIARKHGGELVLLTVCTTGSERLNSPSKAYLELKVGELKSQGVKVSTAIVHGSIAEKIVDFGANNKIDLIAISSHGYSGFKRLVLGSVAQMVIGSTHLPVLLLRPEAAEVGEVGCKKILLPLDGSFFSEASIPYVEEMAVGLGADIVLLAVSEPPEVPSDRSPAIEPSWEEYRDALVAEARQQALEYLERVKAGLEDKGIRVTLKVVSGEVAESICDTADCEKVDMIAMATHGRSGVSRLVFGSVARRIADESCQPVLLVRPSLDRDAPA
jgi:nucleotide-binding universal stress UspA family protein